MVITQIIKYAKVENPNIILINLLEFLIFDYKYFSYWAWQK